MLVEVGLLILLYFLIVSAVFNCFFALVLLSALPIDLIVPLGIQFSPWLYIFVKHTSLSQCSHTAPHNLSPTSVISSSIYE